MIQRTSKRIPLSRKYKREKSVKEHKRKMRKVAKDSRGKKAKKDPGIPNLYPYKEQLLKKIAEKAAQVADEKEKRKSRQKKQKSGSASYGMMKLDATQKQAEFEAKRVPENAASSAGSFRSHLRVFYGVVDEADILIQVLDCRDPMGCRSRRIEELVRSKDKRLVFLLNKIDLVPVECARKWLIFLRQVENIPTLAFKASTQKKQRILARSSGAVRIGSTERSDASKSKITPTSECLGASEVLKLLKDYAKNSPVKVGVIGFPNVGKSSVINSLKKERVATVSSTPGMTTSVQQVKLDKNIVLLDSPGVVISSNLSEMDIILRNAVKIEQIDDPVSVVESLLKRCPNEKLQEIYAIPAFNSGEQFIEYVCRRRGFLRKGGLVDMDRGARIILRDWNTGKIPFYSLPPGMPMQSQVSVIPESAAVGEGAQLVSFMGEQFDYDGMLNKLPLVSESGGEYFVLSSGGTREDVMVNVDNMEEEEDTMVEQDTRMEVMEDDL